ncbi:helix-turn-helix transcriptional regulator [Nonomuraea sp. NPDC050404]|uniref:helix-turn-helix domain-containing protein n=1 Tax=Nonomuraea sp. NPDC050404 TaxID=3155783 RepID=UPI0033D3A62A
MSRPRHTPTVRLRRLAAELRHLRASTGLTREEVGGQTNINAATLYRIEYAKAKPQVRTLVALLDAYNASDDQRAELLALLRESGERGWLQRTDLPEPYSNYIYFESEASALLDFEALFVPGLLQTEEYARAVIRGTVPDLSKDEVENRVRARLERQALLKRDEPLRLWAVVDEAVIHRRVGGRQVTHDQLAHLLACVEEPNITLQVIPYDAGAHPGMPGSFCILQYEPGNPDLIYAEGIATDMFLEEESDIVRYTMAFEHLRAIAASPETTGHLLAAAVDELK